MASTSDNYLMKITVSGVRNPVITRTLSVPKDTTFHKFHRAIQIAFGWGECHLYKFDVMEPNPAGRRRGGYQDPLMTLEEEDPYLDWIEPPPQASKRVTLHQVLDSPQYAGKRIEYEYDFGDCWNHEVEKVGTEVGDGRIKCVAGKGHGPAEDCGGVCGWENLKSVYKKLLQAEDREAAIRSLTMEDREVKEWFEEHCSNADSDGLDPNRWSRDNVNAQLARLL